jgi:hypothetical protein
MKKAHNSSSISKVLSDIFLCVHIFYSSSKTKLILYSGYRVPFPGVKRPGRGVNHPRVSSTEVKERVEVYLYSTSGPSWPVLGRNFNFTFSCEHKTGWIVNKHILKCVPFCFAVLL